MGSSAQCRDRRVPHQAPDLLYTNKVGNRDTWILCRTFAQQHTQLSPARNIFNSLATCQCRSSSWRQPQECNMSAVSSQDKEKQARKISYGVDRLIAYVAPPPKDIPKEQYQSWADSHAGNIHTFLQEYVASHTSCLLLCSSSTDIEPLAMLHPLSHPMSTMHQTLLSASSLQQVLRKPCAFRICIHDCWPCQF